MRERTPPFTRNETVFRFAVALAFIAGFTCFLISSLLILNYVQLQWQDPLNHPEMQRLRAQLASATEGKEEIIEAIRTLDLLSRGAFFTSQRMLRLGGIGAVIAAFLCLAALRMAIFFNPRLPAPSASVNAKKYWIERARARETVAFLGGVWLLAALLAAAFTRLDFPEVRTAMENNLEDIAAPEIPVIPDWETIRRQWPNFRGPGGYGIAYYDTAPTSWNVSTGENILWTTEVPLPGFNSPVVWEDRVYLSGANTETREVFCFSSETGALLWRTAVGTRGPAQPLPKVNEDTGYAAPSIAAQGDTICAIFGTGHLACLNSNGSIRWEKFLGSPDNHYGHASSLVIYEDILIVQFDQRRNGVVYGFNLETGTEAWKQSRTHISWASPIIVRDGDHPMLALVSTKKLDVYNPREGTLLWSIECLSGEVGPSPAYGAGMFFVANDYADASAISPPTVEEPEPRIVWQFSDSLPDISSPLATASYFYLLTSRGEIVCLNAADGEVVWVHEHEEPFYASPVLVGDRIYALDKAGTMLIFKNADSWQLVGTSPLEEMAVATSAFLDKRIYARTETSLICIASP